MKVKILVFLYLVAIAFSPRAALANPVKFPTFGIAFTPPDKTTFDLTGSPGCVGLYLFDKDSAYPGAALCIEWVPAKKSTADGMAQSMVHQHGGTILPGTFAIGGEKASKVSADYSVGSFTHRVTYLVAHGNYIYMVSAFNTATADASKPLDGFLPTVSFSAPESPSRYLGELTDSPWSVFGTFTMKFPKSGRKFDSEQNLLNVGINDLSATALDQPFSVDIEPIQLPNPVSFPAIRDAYSANMAKGFNLPADKSFKWRVEDAVPGLNVADAVKVTVKLPDGGSKEFTNRAAILELSPGDFVQFVFTFSDSGQNDAYLHLSDAMLKTVKPTPPAAK